MTAFSVLLFLEAAIALCSAGVAKRQAPVSYDICYLNFVDVQDGTEFDLTSPNYGLGNYQDYTNCATVLQSGEDPLQVTVTFNSQDIEENSECSWDNLCMNGVKFCGTWARKKSFQFLLAELSTLTLRFRTDSSITRPGFSVKVETSIAKSEDEIFQPDSGVGSAANKISYKQVSYYPGYANSYTDRCAGDNNQQYGYNSSTPWYNGTWNDYTSPSYNGSWDWNDYTSPSYNGSWDWNDYTSPSFNESGNWNDYTSPSYNESWNWNDYTSPSYNESGNWNNNTSSSNYEARLLASTTSRRPVSSIPWATSTTRPPTSTTRRPPTSTTRRPTTVRRG